MSYAIQLTDGRVIRHPHTRWTQDQAEQYLAALLEQARCEDGMGDDLEEVFGPVLDDYETILAGAQVIPLATGPERSDDQTRTTTDRPRKKLGVQFIGKTKRILIGRVNEAQDSLVGETEDATDNAVQAVAEYVIHAFDGALETEYEDGITYQIHVVKMIPNPDGSSYELHPDGTIVGTIRDEHQ